MDQSSRSLASDADNGGIDPNAVHDGKEYDVVKEGLAEILKLRDKNSTANGKQTQGVDFQPQAVFYNPIQQFNRDLSVLAIRIFGDDITAIRKARQERRLQKLTNKGFKGKKRGKNTGGNFQDEVLGGNGREGDAKWRGKKRKRDDEGIPADIGIELTVGDTKAKRHDSRSSQDPVHEDKDATYTVGNNDLSTELTTKVQTVEFQEIRSAINSNQGADFDFTKVPKCPRTNLDKATSESGQQNGELVKSSKPAFRILDALSATGLRALRYAKEIPLVTSVTANDLSSSATASIKLNVQHNMLTEKVFPVTGNALTHMYRVGSEQSLSLPDGCRAKYDVIDLDPYGTAAPFLDAAVQALQDGGLLCVTCTDSGVFASVGYLEKTFSQYGGLPFKGPQSHEGGLRLILHAIATSAARYGIAIEPMLSLSIDFYIRVFVRVRRSAAEVKLLAGKTMLVYNCDEGCGAWSTQFLAQTKAKKNKQDETFYKFTLGQGPSAAPNCEHCSLKTHLSGPMWGGPLHNPHFIQRILDILPSLDKETYATIPRIEGMLSTALHETFVPDQPNESSDSPQLEDPTALNPSDPSPSTIPRLDPSLSEPHPFFVIPSVLAKILHCVAPSDAFFRGAFHHLGYRTTRSHTKPGSIRTDAPWSVIWEVMREWVRQKSPIKADAIKPGTAGWSIMRRVRGGAVLEGLRNDLAEVLRKAEDLGQAKVEIEAALYRVGKADVKTESGSGEEGGETEINGGKDCEAVEGTATSDGQRLKVVFDERLGKEPEGKKLVRYQMNPRANWGPMNRAKGGSGKAEQKE